MLAACPAVSAPQVVFPSSSPSHATGPGAIVWAAGASCLGGPGARVQTILPGRRPLAPARPRSSSGAPLDPLGPLEARGSPHGEIAISGRNPGRPGGELLVQGRAGGAFRSLDEGPALSPPGTLASAYLGDLALLAPAPGPSPLTLSVERFYANALGPSRPLGAHASGPPSAPSVAMDYRSDALVAWAQGGSVWAAFVPAGQAPQRAQRLGPAGSSARIAALLSDDGRGIVLWSARSADTTATRLDYSAPGVRFGAPRLLAAASDADPAARPPRLIRLSSESVMAAWQGLQNGRWVVRAAPMDQHGLRAVTTIAAPAGDALLEALAPGPHDEAVALVREPRAASAGGPALLAARGFEAAGRAIFAAAETIDEAATTMGATVAIEPESARAVAAWQGVGGRIYYSIWAPGAGT